MGTAGVTYKPLMQRALNKAYSSKEVVTPEQAEGLSEGHKINIVTSLSEISPP
ncbi:hypothetical protein ALT785_270026 [Alteromonas infernus]